MRYKETGEVHLDFHRTLNGTIGYLRDTYGRDFLDETFRRTARDVYRAIHDDLKRGNPEHLVEHWRYFFDRDGGQCSLERNGEKIRFAVHHCPAVAYLESRGINIDHDFCRQTTVVNETLAEETPFEITTEPLESPRQRRLAVRVLLRPLYGALNHRLLIAKMTEDETRGSPAR